MFAAPMLKSTGRTPEDFPKVCLLESNHVAALLSIQLACPEIAQWPANDYIRIARGEIPASRGFVAARGPDVVGFLVARQLVSDLEILNLAVHPGSRRLGAGAALLASALLWGSSFEAESAFLEVRETNIPALRFYKIHDFRITGRRRGYYTSPVEDALLLAASLRAGKIP
jgi:ribosomal-protein-alanine N-acetyltransferase